MPHFAKVVDGIVQQVIVAEPEFFDSFIDSTPGEWIQCSYNTQGGLHLNPETMEPDDGIPLRYNYPGPGFHYDPEFDAFYEPKPFKSWILNTKSFTWEAPIQYPNDGVDYYWDETKESWEEITSSS
jgi:hypothetical protein